MADSTIEWTDKTWNPVRGCSVISPGCVNCYAMKQGHRFSGKGKAYEGLTKQTKAGPQWTGTIATIEGHLLDPLKWRSPKRVFVNSMSDLFHDGVPDKFIDQVFATMAAGFLHTYQVLTKRPDRMRAYMSAPGLEDRIHWASLDRFGHKKNFDSQVDSWVYGRWPLPNVWLGVSVENQQFANERIPVLLDTPAAIRFVSAEPLLGPVNFRPHFYSFAVKSPGQCAACGHGHGFTRCPNYGGVSQTYQRHRGGPVVCKQFVKPTGIGIDMVIFGGEAGPGHRGCQVEWIQDGVAQCREAGVAPFVKQLGAKPIVPAARLRYWEWRHVKRPEDKLFVDADGKKGLNNWWRVRLKNRKGGDMAEWPEHLRVREYPRSAVPA